MNVESLSPRAPTGPKPGKLSGPAALRDLVGGIVFYGLLGLGLLGPVCLALIAELSN